MQLASDDESEGSIDYGGTPLEQYLRQVAPEELEAEPELQETSKAQPAEDERIARSAMRDGGEFCMLGMEDGQHRSGEDVPAGMTKRTDRSDGMAVEGDSVEAVSESCHMLLQRKD